MTRVKLFVNALVPFMTLFLLAVAVPGGRPDPAEAAEEGFRILTFAETEQFEYRGGRDETFSWDAQGWVGGDYDRIWIKTQGDAPLDGGVKDAEVQLLYSRTVSAYWDFQAGVRDDIDPDPSRGYGVMGIQGLAPYFFEVDAAAFVSDKGDVSARVEAEYELLLTQRLIAKPSAELNFALQEVEELGIGSGLSEVELGLRFRYEIVREFAPYIGVNWERTIGPTADFARRRGEDVGELTFVGGIHFWF